MVASVIATRGNKVPVLVRKNGVHESGPLAGKPVIEVIGGRQRTRWLRAANAILRERGAVTLKLKAIPEKGDEKQMAGLVVIENTRIEETALDRGERALALMEVHGYSLEELVPLFGKHKGTIAGWLKLAEAHTSVKRAMRSEQLTPNGALEIVRQAKNQEEQPRLLEEAIANGTASAKAIKRSAQVKKTGEDKTGISRGELNKLIAMHDQGDLPLLSAEVVKAFRVVTGSLDPKAIAGLTAALKQLRNKE
jgi:hypothetical protein